MKECIPEDKKELKYNYVFLFTRYDYWKTLLGEDFYHGRQTRAYKLAFNGNRFLQILFRIHWSYKINKKIRLPFKRIWFKKMYEQDFDNNKPICFVYVGSNSIRFDGGFTKYVRKKSPDNRQVIINSDLITKKCNYDYSIIRDKVDAAVTYDKAEAEKYGIHCYPSRIYTRELPLTEPNEFEYDAYFLGNAKDRLPQIMQVYYKLRDAGLRCCFLLANVPTEAQKKLDGVSYIQSVSYEENLSYVQKSKCIVEISQQGSAENTIRLCEAAMYHRKLLTNCAQTTKHDYYIPEIMSVFSSFDELDVDFVKEPIPYDIFAERDIDFSSQRLMMYLDDILSE